MIDQIIYEYWESEPQKVIERDISLDIKSDMVNDIVGIRRAGKTFLMFELINKLSKKIDKKATIYVNFENRKLLPLRETYFNDIVKFIYTEKLIEKYKRIYLFLDEVQRIKGWEKFVRSIYDEFKGKIKIFVSGSSANLLSKDYGKLLTGRHLTTKVFPLSFKEFLKFKDLEVEPLTEKKITEIKNFLKEYLRYGGFPEITLSNNKEELLNQLFGDLMARDILGRAEIRKEQIMEEFAYYLTSNVSNTLSFNKMSNYFKSKGIKISVSTIENYFYLMKNAFLFFDNLIFSYKVKDQLQYPRKIYCIDSGLVNLMGFKFSKDVGKIYENTVAVELLRRLNRPSIKSFYWKNPQQEEVDFVIKEGIKIKQLIQVCHNIEDEKTKKREIRALIKASKELKCKNLLVITEDYETEEKVKWFGSRASIKFIPLWKWLLKI